MTVAHMFWHGEPLGRLERVCMRSFVAQGYDLVLWSYDTIGGVPDGVRRADAREILPESALFLNRRGSLASFADWFRYELLCRHGGLYADTDVIALRPAAALPAGKFLVSQREWSKRRFRPRHWRIAITNNVIFSPAPAPGDLLDLARAYAARFPKSEVDWSELGPWLLQAIVGIHEAHGYTVMPPAYANPLGYWQAPAALLRPGRLPEKAAFLHGYNEMWRRAGMDKAAPFPPGSLLAGLEARFV